MQTTETSFERRKALENSSVVILENPTDKDFTHSYDGIPWTINAGERIAIQYPIAMLLARHLAMRTLRDDKFNRKIIGKGHMEKEINVFEEANIVALINKMVVKTVTREAEVELSEAEKMKLKAKALQEEFKDELKKKDPEEPEPMDKKEVIAELTKRGVKFDARATKEKLFELLIDSEKNAE